jgi:hypothetical protein
MKKILILTVLLMMLAAPVLAGSKGIPNEKSQDSTAYWAFDDYFYYGRAPPIGYSGIGWELSSVPDPSGGVSSWAKNRGP